MRRPEQAIQRAVFQHIAARPAPGVFAFHPANGGRRSPLEAAIMKGLGVVAGVPDVIAIREGAVFGLELKAPGGRVSAAQIAVHDALRAAGAKIAIATGIDDALAYLEAWGVLRGCVNSKSKTTKENQ